MARTPKNSSLTRRGLLGVAAAATAAPLLWQEAQIVAAQPAGQRLDPIIGSWRVSWQAATRTTYAQLFFFSSGIVQGFEAPIVVGPEAAAGVSSLVYQCPLGGEWRRADEDEYAFSISGINYDARGNALSFHTVTGIIHYNPTEDTWLVDNRRVVETEVDGTVLLDVQPTSPYRATRLGLRSY